MAERLYYCGICQMKFSGPAPSQQHYESQKHKKREEVARQASLSSPHGSKYYCKVCNIACDTDVMLRIHEQSDRHKQMVIKVDHLFPEVVQLTNRLEVVSLEKEHVYEEIVARSLQSPATSGKTDQPTEVKYFEFFGDRGTCYACQIELTSRKHAEQHLSGQKHQKAVKVAQAQKQFFGVNSLSHQERSSSSMCSYASSNHEVTSGQFSGDQSTGHLSSTDAVPQRAFPLSQNSSLSINLIEDPIPVSSRPSQKPALQSYLEGRVEPKSLECSVCNKRMLSYEQLLLHNESDVHRRKTEQLKSLTSYVDNTIWYPCPQCSKPLNSIKSLRNHFVDAHQMTEAKINEFFEEQRTNVANEQHTSNDLRSGTSIDLRSGTSIDLRSGDAGERRIGTTQSGAKSISGHFSNVAATPEGPTKSGFSNPIATDVGDRARLEYSLFHKENLEDVKCVNYSALQSTEEHRNSPDKDQASNGGLLSSGSPPRGIFHNATPAERSTPERQFAFVSDAGISVRCGKSSCMFHCNACSLCLNSVQQKKDHAVGSQHLKRLVNTSDGKPSPRSGKFYCALCEAFMNTQKDYDIHLNGQQHTLRAAKKVPAPERDLLLVSKTLDRNSCQRLSDSLTVSLPRSYQVELYVKAMETDTVCFLPTGTGKTLVSIMVMSHMLALNPRRPAVFLVDKILLVLQQSEEIRKQIGDILFTRWNASTEQLEQRKLRIAELCSGKQNLNESEVWQQDVVVITAAYYSNLLDSGSLRWADNCLVVFDEVHHCVKQHPYRVILEKAALSHPDPLKRPKILGLTASPAGKSTIKGTVDMLQGLLSRLGDQVKLITVEGPETLAELQKYQSNTELVVREVEHSKQEVLFRDTLRRYLLVCWIRLKSSVQFSDGDEVETIFGNMTKDSVEDHLSAVTVDAVSRLYDKLELVTGNERNVEFKSLKSHLEVLCQSLIALETLGVAEACRELSLLSEEYFGGFSTAAQLGLPYEKLAELTKHSLDNHNQEKCLYDVDKLDEGPGREDLVPVFRLLVKEIVERLDKKAAVMEMMEKGEDAEKPLVLVLVRRRKDAQSLTKLLENSTLLKERGMGVTYVVGHGAGKDGMAVSAQERVLNDIREHKYQVIVATSVAEEGLDFPLCELVVQLNPPDTVRALVQIRGRARKKGSRFVAFCQTPESKRNFDELREQEEHMIEAVKQLTTRNADTSINSL